MCGENAAGGGKNEFSQGSSPRVRGKPASAILVQLGERLIPACAGKTPPKAHWSPTDGAHPRVCGENVVPRALAGVTAGSSPRVRGKQALPVRARLATGLIPACAGKTWRGRRFPWGSRAHPRVCGENADGAITALSIGGSSPRVRGKRRTRLSLAWKVRLIPACAGKTLSVRTRSRKVTAHPRVCGENSPAGAAGVGAGGSSPRVRGKQLSLELEEVERWLIPACAGKTALRSATVLPASAHPRVCGENYPLLRPFMKAAGSSPRVRGKLILAMLLEACRGLIPACAGKTRSACALLSLEWAHPRVCGENRCSSLSDLADAGSSPRVRGKPGIASHAAGSSRLIPACAGKTTSR